MAEASLPCNRNLRRNRNIRNLNPNRGRIVRFISVRRGVEIRLRTREATRAASLNRIVNRSLDPMIGTIAINTATTVEA
jgi:hypothetical protein